MLLSMASAGPEADRPPRLHRCRPRAHCYSEFLLLGSTGSSSSSSASSSSTKRSPAASVAEVPLFAGAASSSSSSLSACSSSFSSFGRRTPMWTTPKTSFFAAGEEGTAVNSKARGGVRNFRDIHTHFQALLPRDGTGGTSAGQPTVPAVNPNNTMVAPVLPGQEQATQQLGSGAQKLGEGANQVASNLAEGGALPPKEALPDSVNIAAETAGQQSRQASEQAMAVEQEVERSARQEAWLASYWLDQHHSQLVAGGTMLLGMAAGIGLVAFVAGNPMEEGLGRTTSLVEGAEEEVLPELSYEEQRQKKLDEMVQMELRRRDLESKWKALLAEEEAAAEAVRELLPQEEEEEEEEVEVEETAAAAATAADDTATGETTGATAAGVTTSVSAGAVSAAAAAAAAGGEGAASSAPAAAPATSSGAAASSSTAAPAAVSSAQGPAQVELPTVDFDNLLSSVLDRTKQVIVEGQEMQQATDKSIDELRRKLPQLIKDEINAGVADLEQVLSGEPPPIDVSRMDQLPSISLILGSLCAPTQLTALGYDSLARMAFSGSILAVDLYALWRAYGVQCLSYTFDFLGPDRVVYTFVSVDACMLAFTVAVSARAYLDATAVAAAVAEDAAEAPEFDIFGDPEEEFHKQIDHRLINGMKAMLAYDRCTKSLPHRMLPFINIFDFFWQMGSLVVFFDTPGKSCQATFMLEWFRSRGLIFLVGLLPMLTGLGLAVVKASVQSKGFAAALLSAGQAVDAAAFGDGPQLCTIFIKAFWVRDTVDTTTLEMNVLRSEASKLGAQLAKARAEAEKCAADFDAKEAKANAAAEAASRQAELVLGSGRQQEFLNQYRDAINLLTSTQQAMADAHNLAQTVSAGEIPTAQLTMLQNNAAAAVGAAVSSGGGGAGLDLGGGAAAAAAAAGEEEQEGGGVAGSGGTGGG